MLLLLLLFISYNDVIELIMYVIWTLREWKVFHQETLKHAQFLVKGVSQEMFGFVLQTSDGVRVVQSKLKSMRDRQVHKYITYIYIYAFWRFLFVQQASLSIIDLGWARPQRKPSRLL